MSHCLHALKDGHAGIYTLQLTYWNVCQMVHRRNAWTFCSMKKIIAAHDH